MKVRCIKLRKYYLLICFVLLPVLLLGKDKKTLSVFPAWMDETVFERKKTTGFSGPIDPETGLKSEFSVSPYGNKVRSKLPDMEKMRQKSVKTVTSTHTTVEEKLLLLLNQKKDFEKLASDTSQESKKISFLDSLKDIEAEIRYLEKYLNASATVEVGK